MSGYRCFPAGQNYAAILTKQPLHSKAAAVKSYERALPSEARSSIRQKRNGRRVRI
jgi:hypothetical protein